MDETRPVTIPTSVCLGLVGLALIIGGWMLSTWTPPRLGDDLFADVRGMADGELAARMDTIRQGAKPVPPFRMAGQLALFFGVGLFVLALARMSKAPAREGASHAEPAQEPAS